MIDWTPHQPLVLETERFIVRSLAPAGITEAYISWWNDEEVQTGLGQAPRGWGRAEAVQHVKRFDNNTRFHLGIHVRGEGTLIGFIAIFLEGQGRALTNIVIGDKSYWGKGVVLEVRARVLDFIFDHLGLEKVHGRLIARNFPSICNYHAQGFTCEGVLRSHDTAPDGSRADICLFGLLREEWQARKGSGKGR